MLESLVFFLSCAECCLPGTKKEWQAVTSFPVQFTKQSITIPLAVSMLLTLSDWISEQMGMTFFPFLSLMVTFKLIWSLGECNSLEKAAAGGGYPPRVSHLTGSTSPAQPFSRIYRPLVTCYMQELICHLLSPFLEEDIMDVPAHQCYTGRVEGRSGVKARAKASQAVRN